MVFASLDGIKSDKYKKLYLTYVSSVMTTSLNEIFKAIFFFLACWRAWNSPCEIG